MASQVIFGLVAGYTVTKLGKIERLRQVPLPVRLGLETPGLGAEHSMIGSRSHDASAMTAGVAVCWG